MSIENQKKYLICFFPYFSSLLKFLNSVKILGSPHLPSVFYANLFSITLSLFFILLIFSIALLPSSFLLLQPFFSLTLSPPTTLYTFAQSLQLLSIILCLKELHQMCTSKLDQKKFPQILPFRHLKT